MTKFQAIFILWLRHPNFCDYSFELVQYHYYNRYNFDGTRKSIDEQNNKTSLSNNIAEKNKGIRLVSEAYNLLNRKQHVLNFIDLNNTSVDLSNHSDNKILSFLKKEIREVRRIVRQRAIDCDIPFSEELFSIEKNPFDDWLDRENHEFDIGKYITLVEIYNKAKNDNWN